MNFFGLIYTLFKLFLLYKLYSLQPVFTILLIFCALVFLIRWLLINPQVPLGCKLIDLFFRFEHLITGEYTGHFYPWRFKANRAWNKLIGAGPPESMDPPGLHIERFTVPSLIDDHQIPMKIYIDPNIQGTDQKLPIVYYNFGGAFLHEVPFLHTEKVIKSGFIVVYIKYRLAPEYKFPTALEDSYSALSYINNRTHPLFKHWDGRIALWGCSAGGNIINGCSMLMRDRGMKMNVVCQILDVPAMFNTNGEAPSHEKYRDWYIHGEKTIRAHDEAYIRSKEDYENPYLCPLKAKDYSGLPDTYFLLAERDFFCSDGEEYYRRLKESGNDAVCTIYAAEHGFTDSPDKVAIIAIGKVLSYLQEKMQKAK